MKLIGWGVRERTVHPAQLSASVGNKSFDLVISPYSINEANTLVARECGCPAFCLFGKIVSHETPERATNDLDWFMLGDVEDLIISVNSHTLTEKLTCTE